MKCSQRGNLRGVRGEQFFFGFGGVYTCDKSAGGFGLISRCIAWDNLRDENHHSASF